MIEQRSEKWFVDRAGKITASRMHDVMAFGKQKKNQGEPLKARRDYAFQLTAERITGQPKDQIKAKSLEWGEDVEPAARAEYQARRGVIVERCGFITHPEFNFIGASPDSLVGIDGGLEIKCPYNPEVHLETLEEGLPDEHIEQIQGGLWVTNRKWWDFVSYHPKFPEHKRIYIQRVERDDEYISKLAEACISLEQEVQKIVCKYLMEEAA